MFLYGCAVPGFDVTQPLINIKPKDSDNYIEQIAWNDYDDEEFGNLPFIHYGCALVYIRTSLGCSDCYSMEKMFHDKMTVAYMNEFFINYMITSGDPDWEKAIDRFNVSDVPKLLIFKFDPYNESPINHMLDINEPMKPEAFNDIIVDISEECH